MEGCYGVAIKLDFVMLPGVHISSGDMLLGPVCFDGVAEF